MSLAVIGQRLDYKRTSCQLTQLTLGLSFLAVSALALVTPHTPHDGTLLSISTSHHQYPSFAQPPPGFVVPITLCPSLLAMPMPLTDLFLRDRACERHAGHAIAAVALCQPNPTQPTI